MNLTISSAERIYIFGVKSDVAKVVTNYVLE